MKREFVIYGQRVAMVGKLISKTAEKFDQLSKTNINSLDDIYFVKQGYEQGLKEFKMQENILRDINAPNEIKDEHAQLINYFNDYVKATETLINCLDLEKIRVDQELFQQGLNDQQLAAKKIVKLCNEIVEKMK